MSAAVLSSVSPAPPAGGQPQAQVSRYGVVLGSVRLLLAADGAVRVLEPPPLFRLPNTHRWFQGIANVRGVLVPVHDLAAWLNLPAPDEGRMLLVVGDGDASAGVLVDSSPRHLLVAADAVSQAANPLPEALAPFAGDTFDVAGETWTDVDWTAVFVHLRTQALVGA